MLSSIRDNKTAREQQSIFHLFQIEKKLAETTGYVELFKRPNVEIFASFLSMNLSFQNNSNLTLNDTVEINFSDEIQIEVNTKYKLQ